MSELSPEVRALLAQAGAQHDPSEQELERGLGALHATLAFSAPVLVASAASASVAPAATKGALFGAHVAKLYVVAAVVIGGAGAVAVLPKPVPAVVEASKVQIAPAKVEVAPVQRTEPTPAVELPKPVVRARSGNDLAAELRVIEAAQQDLQRAQPARALQKLDQHARSNPKGQLASEREALRAIALCEAGRSEQGQLARDAFLSRHGGTPIAARVRKACP